MNQKGSQAVNPSGRRSVKMENAEEGVKAQDTDTWLTCLSPAISRIS